MSVILPEIVIQDALRIYLNIVRKDWNDVAPTNQTEEQSTLLYKILGSSIIDNNYDLFEQAKTVIIDTKESDDPRHLQIFLSYDNSDTKYPSVHITLPSEDVGPVDALSWGENDYDDNPADEDTVYTKTFNRSFQARYNVLIISDNRNELALLYHFIKSGLISLQPHLMLSGLRNLKISGGDMRWNPQVPPGVFNRVLSMMFYYDVNAPDLDSTPSIGAVSYIQKTVENL